MIESNESNDNNDNNDDYGNQGDIHQDGNPDAEFCTEACKVQ